MYSIPYRHLFKLRYWLLDMQNLSWLTAEELSYKKMPQWKYLSLLMFHGQQHIRPRFARLTNPAKIDSPGSVGMLIATPVWKL